MNVNLIIMFVSLVIFLLIKIPIAFALGLSSIIFLFLSDIDIIMAAQRMFAAGDSFTLTAIPFFILAGILMSAGGLTRRIINFGYGMIGHVRGSLALVNVVASMIFGGISGSSLADTAGIGSILIPAMKEKGYDADFSAGVTAASSTIGNIIPPSINALIYASVASVSVGKLFLAGALPGILIGFVQMAIAYIISIKRGYPVEAGASLEKFVLGLKDGIGAIIMPFIILGGIVGGIVTPTEAGILAVTYGFLVSFFVYRELKLNAIWGILIETTSVTAAVMMILVTANIFAWIISFAQVPQVVASLLTRISMNPYVILVIINIILLFVGTFMDPGPAIIIFTPMFLPVIARLGVDPVLFGLIIILNVIIGVVTPPVGACLFAASKISGVPVTRVFREILPFLIANLGILFLVTFFHRFAMFLPNLLMK